MGTISRVSIHAFVALTTAVAARAGVFCCVLFMVISARALAQTSATDNPGPAAAQPSVPALEQPAAAAEEKPPAADDKPATAEQQPAPAEEKPAIAQDKPGAVEEKSAATDDKPAIVEQSRLPTRRISGWQDKPVAVEEKPAAAVDKPAIVEQTSAIPDAKPAVVEQNPASRGKTSGCARSPPRSRSLPPGNQKSLSAAKAQSTANRCNRPSRCNQPSQPTNRASGPWSRSAPTSALVSVVQDLPGLRRPDVFLPIGERGRGGGLAQRNPPISRDRGHAALTHPLATWVDRLAAPPVSSPNAKSFHHRPADPKSVEPAHSQVRRLVALQARQRLLIRAHRAQAQGPGIDAPDA